MVREALKTKGRNFGTIRLNTRYDDKNEGRLYPFDRMTKVGDHFIVSKKKIESMKSPHASVISSAKHFGESRGTNFKVATRTQTTGGLLVVRVK